jgi:hypothetical protein
MSEYANDCALWSREQAQLPRRAAAGEQPTDQVDWENMAAGSAERPTADAEGLNFGEAQARGPDLPD